MGWIPTNGTADTGGSDTGYLQANSQLVTVTIAGVAVRGDIVRIAGAGGGGWLVKENSGQSIVGNFAAYRNGYLAALLGPTADGSRGCQFGGWRPDVCRGS